MNELWDSILSGNGFWIETGAWVDNNYLFSVMEKAIMKELKGE